MHQPAASRGSPTSIGPGRHLRQRSSQAFTLAELLIVVAIIALLVVVAIPLYQRARNSALIGSMVSDLLGYARVCAVINSSGLGTKPVPALVTADRGGIEITEGCTGVNQGATLEASWGMAKASGILCVDTTSEVSSSKARVTITPQNALSCVFED